ncbi:hypothetical protein ACMHYB_07670 [Sorangium sp. So ce1128]
MNMGGKGHIDPVCETSLIDEAVDAGIKVITYGGDAPSSKHHAYYGMDNRAAAAFLVDALATINEATGVRARPWPRRASLVLRPANEHRRRHYQAHTISVDSQFSLI